jgi:hypothetical protein
LLKGSFLAFFSRDFTGTGHFESELGALFQDFSAAEHVIPPWMKHTELAKIVAVSLGDPAYFC